MFLTNWITPVFSIHVFPSWLLTMPSKWSDRSRISPPATTINNLRWELNKSKLSTLPAHQKRAVGVYCYLNWLTPWVVSAPGRVRPTYHFGCHFYYFRSKTRHKQLRACVAYLEETKNRMPIFSGLCGTGKERWSRRLNGNDVFMYPTPG